MNYKPVPFILVHGFATNIYNKSLISTLKEDLLNVLFLSMETLNILLKKALFSNYCLPILLVRTQNRHNFIIHFWSKRKVSESLWIQFFWILFISSLKKTKLSLYVSIYLIARGLQFFTPYSDISRLSVCIRHAIEFPHVR